MLVASLAITRLASPDAGLSQITRPNFYRTPAYAGGVYGALARVPATASVASDDYVLPHLSRRRRLDLLDPQTVGRAEYIVINSVRPTCCGDAGNASYAGLGGVLGLELARTTPIYYDRGWLVARRPPAGPGPANGVLAPMSGSVARRVRKVAAPWLAELAVGLARTCATPTGCPGTAPLLIAASSSALPGAIRTVLPGLRGGCAELGAAAAVASERLTRDLVAIARPGGSGFPRAVAAAESDEASLGLSGAIVPFLVLCTPRRGAA